VTQASDTVPVAKEHSNIHWLLYFSPQSEQQKKGETLSFSTWDKPKKMGC
jgi:hypothetical protein